jgi:protein TonB
MIAKKNPRYDLERKRIVLFQIGLLTAGSFTLAAFTYKVPDIDEGRTNSVAFSEINFEIEEKREIPKQETPIIKPIELPQPPQTGGASINIDPTIGQQITLTSNGEKKPDPNVGVGGLNLPFGDLTGGGLVKIDEEILDIVDIDAEYIGGYVEMMKFILANLDYPDDAIDLGEQGRVFVNFVVEKDGSLSNVKIERGVSDAIDREAVRIVRLMPNWKPGELNYTKVRTRVRLPINFVLKNN